MNTVYDWITVAIFCGIVLLFLQRSAGQEKQGDRMIAYLPPVIGCAVANQLGNHGAGPWALLLIGLILVYVALVLKPFPLGR